MSFAKDQTPRELVTVALEKALSGAGMPLYTVIVQRLQNQYNRKLSDCYEHPEYLKEIFKDLYGNAHESILKSINEDLEKVLRDHGVERFLHVINNDRRLI